MIFYGQTHSELPEKIVRGVLMAQPKNWRMSLARAAVEMHREDLGGSLQALPHDSNRQVDGDAETMKLAEPYHEETEKYLDTPIARSPKALSAKYAI